MDGSSVNFKKKKKVASFGAHKTLTFMARGRGRGEEVATRAKGLGIQAKTPG